MRTIDRAELRVMFPAPAAIVVDKQLTSLDKHSRHFISLSPFVLIGSRSGSGGDVSPRGDPKGFVKVLDAKTFLIPDRPGNNRLDTMENILADPVVGCLFLVPGLGEILRINGVADLVVGDELSDLAVQGRAPPVAIRVHVREVFFHCSKAVIRSKIWTPTTFAKREDFPPLGAILADQIAGIDKEEWIEKIRVGDQNTLY